MQTEEREDTVGVGTIEDDNQVIEIEDDIQDDISEAFDELSEKQEESSEITEETENDLETDLLETAKELENKEEVPEKKIALDPSKPTAHEVDIKAPARFTAEEKEVFNKLPPELKKTAKKAFDDMQADYTKTKQFLSDGVRQLEAEKALNSELTKTMNRYLTKWGSNGITPEQAITALASVQDELTNPDKEVRKQAYARLLVNSALSPEDFVEILGGQVPQSQPQQNNSQPPLLTEAEKSRQLYIDSLIERDRNLKRQQEEQEVLTVVQEIEQVREAKDANGRYLYPKLHDHSFVEQAKPLVLAIMRTTGDSWGNAFKKAYQTLVPDSQSIGQTRLPSNINNRSGSTIVRESPTIRSNGQPSEFPDWGKDDGLSLEEDIMAAAEMLKRGGSGHY